MKLKILRDTFTPDYTLGVMYVDGALLGQTCEDTDRHLESGGVKIPGKTAIPRGTYRVVMSFSPHFGRVLPEVQGVPGYAGVRIHGGNTAADTLGCPLLGAKRTDSGVRDCGAVNALLASMIAKEAEAGRDTWLEVS